MRGTYRLAAAVACRSERRPRRELTRLLTPALSPQAGIGSEGCDEPAISAIGRVSEIVTVAGGEDVFADRSRGQSARERFVSAEEIIAAAPEIVTASWCGKKFAPARFRSRPGFEVLPAVKAGALYEIKSALILQPGPAALTDGLAEMELIIGEVARRAV